jgi:hypothetical protein
MGMSKAKQIYTATAPDAGESVSISTVRALEWATWGYDGNESAWVHLGWSTCTDRKAAESSARSTGPYFHRWAVTTTATVPPIPGVLPGAGVLDIEQQRHRIEWSSGAAVFGDQ